MLNSNKNNNKSKDQPHWPQSIVIDAEVTSDLQNNENNTNNNNNLDNNNNNSYNNNDNNNNNKNNNNNNNNIELHFNNVIDITHERENLFTNKQRHHTIIDRKFGENSFHCENFFLEKRTDFEQKKSNCLQSSCKEYQSRKNRYCKCREYNCTSRPRRTNHGRNRVTAQDKNSSIKEVGNTAAELKNSPIVNGQTIHSYDMLGHLSTALILIKILPNEVNEARELFEKKCAQNRGKNILCNQETCICPVDKKYINSIHSFLIPLQSILDDQIKTKFPCGITDKKFVIDGREKPFFASPIITSYFSYLQNEGNNLEDIFVVLMTEKEKERNKLSFPGGKMERNENPLQTLIREVKEEIGVNLELLCDQIQFVHASCDFNRILFLHTYFFQDYRQLIPESQIPELKNATDGAELQITVNDTQIETNYKAMLPENDEELQRRMLNLTLEE